MLAQGEKPFKLPIPHCWIGSGHGLPSPVIKILGGNRMVQLPTKGVTLQIPEGSSRRLNVIGVRMAREFNREIKCSQKDRKAIWTQLGLIIGRAVQATDRPDASDVTAILRSASRAAQTLQPLLNAYRKGFSIMSSEEHAAASALMGKLAEDPELQDPEGAQNFLLDLAGRCSALSKACDLAATELDSMKGKKGRHSLRWYREFTFLLAALCDRYGLSTKLHRNVEGYPGGPIYRLAEFMECLLPKALRSPTDEARFKRLSRALKVMTQADMDKYTQSIT
jgi:hypothetical protein